MINSLLLDAIIMWAYRILTAYRRKCGYLLVLVLVSFIIYTINNVHGGLNSNHFYMTKNVKDSKNQRARHTDKLSKVFPSAKNTDVYLTSDKVLRKYASHISNANNKSLRPLNNTVETNKKIRKAIKVPPPRERMAVQEGDPNNTFDGYFDDLDLQFDKQVKEDGFRHEDEAFKTEYGQMSDYWKSVADGIGVNRKLYQNDFDVNGLLGKLQTSKILNISFLFNRPTLKWILTLEGGQKAVFKPNLNVKEKQRCKIGCEHPEYEIGGFTINRMLGLNTMPFTTGRTLDWFNDIDPIAPKGFKRLFIVYHRYLNHSKVCVKWTCRSVLPAIYCFPEGRIFGSIMYWVNADVVELRHFSIHRQKYSRYHPMYFGGSFPTKPIEKLGIGDSRWCDLVRQKPPYNDENSFLYILDMAVEDFLTQSKNSKHNVLYLDSSNTTKFDVVIDKGKGFCPFENDLLLAPIYQCCKIRKSVYEALVKIEQRFSAIFQEMVLLKREILTKSQLDGIESRVSIILDYVKKCFELKGIDNVLLNN